LAVDEEKQESMLISSSVGHEQSMWELILSEAKEKVAEDSFAAGRRRDMVGPFKGTTSDGFVDLYEASETSAIPPSTEPSSHAFPESLQIHCRTLLLSPATALFPSASSLTTMDNSSSTDSPYILSRSPLRNHLSNTPIVDSAVPPRPSDERHH
jgi:hypothetical protein